MLRDSSISFRERVFILLTLIMEPVMIMGLAGDIFYKENPVEIAALTITAFLIPLTTIIAVRKNRVYIAVRIIVLSLVGVLLPILFYFGGGLHGGGLLWIIFAYLYTGLILSGLWKPLMLIALTIESGIFYLHDYYYPQWIHQHTNEVFHIDSFLALVMVGSVCCVMVWFVEWLLREETRKVQEEARKYEELNKARSRFFSSMSHEIRTPINSILGLNEIILRQEDASEEIRKDAANIQGAGKMLLALVNDILDVSKIEAGKMDIVPVNYDIASMLSEIVNMIWMRAEQKGLELKLEIDPTIPGELFGDEMRIKQILVNLLNNAVKYTKEGSITLHIEKEDARDDDVRLLFSVTDTGMGIKQDSIPYLFDAFQRVDEEKNRRIEGTGLGLSIVKQLVDLMGGDVSVSSVYTQGSTFTVSLWQKVTNPIAVGDISITNSRSFDDASRFKSGFTAPTARLLLVDDNEMNLEVERKLIEGTRISIDTVASGVEALSMTTQLRYDVILMDHLMPEMDGIECMQRIRKQVGGLNNHTPIIVLTANASSEDKQLYISSGFDGYLLKPVSGQQLEEILLSHIPQSKVTLSEDRATDALKLSASRGYSKKIPVIITSSSMCDLPAFVIKKLQIDIIPFRIRVDGKEYYDGIEAGADEVIRYMKQGRNFTSDAPSVEEFEFFFAKELKKAHQLIHITIASGISSEYERAKEAAKAYGNVFVFNSGFNSSSIGMIALLAHSMAMQGMTPGNIISELTRLSKNVRCSIMANDPTVLMKRGIISRNFCDFMTSIGIKPFIGVNNDTFKVDALHIGDNRRCYAKYVDYALPRWSRPDPELMFLIYSDMAEEDLAFIEKKIRSRAHFDNIILQKATAAQSINCGFGAFGIMYMEKSDDTSYNFSKLIEGYDSVNEMKLKDADDSEKTYDYRHGVGMGSDIPENKKSSDGDGKEKALKWYEKIEGIDAATAINNSGSEDAFLSVLKIFYDSIDQKKEEICGYFNDGNIGDYTIKVHALKSSARLVGAVELAKDAEDLEMAGKSSDTGFIGEHHEELLHKMEELKERLSVSLENMEDDKADMESEDDASLFGTADQNFDELMINGMYEAITLGVKDRNDKILKGTFMEMADYSFPEKHQKIFLELKERYESGDYAGMEEILASRQQ